MNENKNRLQGREERDCLLYTSDAADDMQCVDLGGRRIIKKKKKKKFFFFFFFYFFFFFFKQKTAYEISACLVGSEMCIRDRIIECIFRLKIWKERQLSCVRIF